MSSQKTIDTVQTLEKEEGHIVCPYRYSALIPDLQYTYKIVKHYQVQIKKDHYENIGSLGVYLK